MNTLLLVLLLLLLAVGGVLLLSRFLARPLLGRAQADEMRRRLLQLTAELRSKEAESQALLDGIVEGVYSVDEERRIRYLNPQAAALLGIDPDEAIGQFCGDVLKPELIDGVRPCATRCPIVHARSRGSTRATEVLRLPQGGRTVVITSSPLVGQQQVQIFRDETDIEGARRARDAIVANISHEFRTPLSAQLATLELLRIEMEGETGDAGPLHGRESAQLLRSLERSSLRLVHLVDNLLESVRMEGGEETIRRAPVALDEVVEEGVALVAPLLRQREQQTEIDLPYPGITLDGDAPRLIQVIVNLLANASRYSPDGTIIRIGATDEGTRCRLWVEDEGPGLPPGTEDSIFDRFSRGGEGEPGGMGLGLWFVKSIVERHGGEIHARSLPERGSRFTMTLPKGPD
jgi:signal transduction histidine kinase